VLTQKGGSTFVYFADGYGEARRRADKAGKGRELPAPNYRPRDPADAGTLDAALAAVAWAIEDRQAHGYILVLNRKSGSGRSSLGFATKGANSSRISAVKTRRSAIAFAV
jgi:hypothetical protein